MPVTRINRSELESGIWLVDLLVRTRLAESKGAARKLIEGGGVYLNNERQTQCRRQCQLDDMKWPQAPFCCAPARKTIILFWLADQPYPQACLNLFSDELADPCSSRLVRPGLDIPCGSKSGR